MPVFPYVNALLQKDHINALELCSKRWVHKDGIKLALHHFVWAARIRWLAVGGGRCRGSREIGQDKVHLDLKFFAVLLRYSNCIRVNVKSDIISMACQR